MQINRLFEIVYLLLDKKTVTARELTEYFGVSRRTICRDIDTLSTAGIPIYTERGKGGGIRLMPDFVLNKSILNDQEQGEILSALQSLTNIKTEETEQVLKKLSTVFGKTSANWLEVDFTGWGYEDDFFSKLRTAITERYIVIFDYYNQSGDKTVRRVEPLQLLFKSGAWYLKGFCLIKQGMRLYKLPRMKHLTVTEERFTERDLHDVTSDLNAAIYEGRRLLAIRLRIDPERAYRVFDNFHESMVEKQPDGSFIVTVEWPEDNWLYGFILSFGKHIEVLEPEELRDFMKQEAKSITEKYL
mgnify:CR=1 FL=1